MKNCCDCNLTKPFVDFTTKKSCADGYEPRCKVCRSIRYNKGTPERCAKKMYNTQVTNSVNRGHVLPSYTLAEFTEWVLAQPTFDALYKAWESSGWVKDLAPSADRKDPNAPYTLDNLQLVTWEVNRAMGAQSKADCELLVNHRGVVAYHKDGSLYKEYASMAEAMREFGGKATQSWGISSVCNGIPVKDGRGALYTPKTYKGYSWKWKDQVSDQNQK